MYYIWTGLTDGGKQTLKHKDRGAIKGEAGRDA